ncbi:MAG: hypothetical protein ACREEK_18850 [Bradyrhizobium sp.]
MDGLLMAVLAFTAGFLTCATLVGALIWWSFSDRRQQREGEPVGNGSERRAVDFLWSRR